MAKDEIDQLAQFIREVDGDHTMGAGELAEKIIAELNRQEALTQQITEYGALVFGFPTALAGWQDWAEEPVNAMEWLPDRDERDDFGTDREDEGYEVEYFTRMVTSPVKDEMEHIQ